MIKKSFYLVTIISGICLLSACGWFGESCGSSAYTYNYTDVNVTAYDNTGFYPMITTDSAYKNAFGLEISCLYDELQTAYNFNLALFSSAYALSCADPEITYADPIKSIKIYMIESNDAAKIDITYSFGISSFYAEEYISIDEFIQLRESWENSFQLELLHSNDILDKCKFIAELHLESGNIFTQETTFITFHSN